MTTEKQEYDAALGGNIKNNHYIQTYEYASDRINEIKSLLQSIRNPSQTKLVFQTLPKHMRRRAMSHNPKRLPRKLRQAHIAQMKKSGIPAKVKRSSRKYRRKPSNLLAEYTRRQQQNIWLETHIWHAKRFHMCEKWGYKLAASSCDKTFRANYRASSKHCLIQDISYMGAIQVAAPIQVLRSAFARMTNAPLGICAKVYTGGQRQGEIDIFKVDKYPYGAIGKIQFIWKALETSEQSDLRTVWIFAHPSFYRDLVAELVDVFEFKETKADDKMRPTRYSNDVGELVELKDNLNRFRLTGPLAQAILSRAFKCKVKPKFDEENWFRQYFKTNSEAHCKQRDYWERLKTIDSPAQLMPNMILALNIEDPRLKRPSKRTKAICQISVDEIKQNEFNDAVLEMPDLNGVSAIWSEHSRHEILEAKMTTHELCSMRNKNCLVPGERCGFENYMQPIPVLLIQRPGSQVNKKLGYGCGWDVVVPAGYGISTWMCLIMWGAKAGGLRETESILRESGDEEFLPDSVAADRIQMEKHQELRKKYFRLPQNKRNNYKKLSIASPFACPWSQLTADWSLPVSSTNEFFVLRPIADLQKIQNVLNRRAPLATIASLPSNCLIPIHLQMDTRGNPDNFSIICLPKQCDLKRNLKKLKRFENDPVYEEPLRPDPDESERKNLRQVHLKVLKRLRRRRVRTKRRKQETAERRVLIAPPGTADLITEQLKRMSELWLPTKPKAVRHQCSREVFGYLTQGNFSFIEACGAGVGYVTLNGLRKLVQVSCAKMKGKCKVLVRATNTRQYRLATLTVRV